MPIAQRMIALPTSSVSTSKFAGESKDEVGQAAELFAKFSPKFADMATKSATVAGAVASMMLMPGPLVAGGVAAMVGGAVTRLTVAPVLMEGRYKSFELKVGSIMESYDAIGRLGECGPEVRAAVAEWDLPRDYTQSYLGDLYVKYLVNTIKTSSVELSEVRKMANLKRALDLDDEQLGHSLVKAAIEVYADVQWTKSLENPASEEYKRVSKMLFIAKTVLRATGSHDEAIDYEIHRLREVFFFMPEETNDRIQEISAMFYKRAVENLMMLDLNAAHPEYLQDLADKLCFDRNLAYQKNVEIYKEAIANMFDDTGLTPEQFGRLDRLAYIFGLPAKTAKEEVATVAVPIFEKAVMSAIFPLTDAEATARKLVAAMRSFRVDENYFKKVYLEAAKNAFQVSLIEVTGAASFGAASDTAEHIKVMIDAKDKTLKVLQLMDMDIFERDVDAELRAMLKAIEPKERAEIFGNALSHLAALAEGGVENLNEGEIGAIKDNLNLGDLEILGEYQRFADPANDRIVDQMLAADIDVDVWAGFQATFYNWLAVVAYPQALLQVYGAQKYETELKRLTKSATHLYSIEDKAKLDALRGFFDLAIDNPKVVKATHETCGPVYQELVAQAVAGSPGGVLPDEYVEKLESFRLRLSLPVRSAKDGMRNTASQVMKEHVENVVKAFEDKTSGAAQRKPNRIDEGEDMYVAADGTELGFAKAASTNLDQAQRGAATSEMLESVAALVNFWEGNHLEDDDVTRGASFVCARSVHLRVKEDMYRACIYEFIKCADPVRRAVYCNAIHTFPTCIDLPAWQAAKVRSEVGEDVVLSYCQHQLANKPSLDANDGLFVTTLSEELKVDLGDVQSQAKSIFLNDKIERITGLDDYEAVTEIKEAAIAMGTDLSPQNANIPEEISRHMFDLEVQHLFETEMDQGEGALNDDELIQEAIVELADVYGQTDEAEQLVAKILGDLASRALEDAQYKSTQFRTAEASKVLDRLIKFTAFIDIETLRKNMNLALINPNSAPNLKLIVPYQIRGDAVKDDLAILKEILQIDEDPENPTREDWVRLEAKDPEAAKSDDDGEDDDEEADEDDYMKEEIEDNKDYDPDEDTLYY